MDLSKLDLLAAMNNKLAYLSERQQRLAQNIANIDTPRYRASDVKKPDFKAALTQASSVGMVQTHTMHLSGMANSGSKFKTELRPNTFELNPSGNNISVEEEMGKVADNNSEYIKTINLYRKTTELFKIALGKGGNG